MKIIDFLSGVLPDVPGCPDETARLAAVRVLQTFCKRTKAWSEWLDPVALRDGLSDYDIDHPTGALSLGVLEVWCGTRQLEGKDPEEIARGLQPGAPSALPLWFNTGARQTITVYPLPVSPPDVSLRIKAVFMPAPTATTIPDDIALFHGDTLEAGVKGVLMLQRKQQWSDDKLGAYWDGIFRKATESAAIDTSHGNVPASTFVRPRAFS